ncbi:hypothetical protein [Alteromonas sp. KUL106]|uniref:hypothetical protein n=1 Tax=Alteromonas sp. KUL106 TaxID=2480799 RepID=UPI0012E54C98|nr:hypothetical protein [Alteromonas sp. KUL106]GFD68068.1 hypothetical protein KUL106_13310 [Alteromonas sp. KUL106]
MKALIIVTFSILLISCSKKNETNQPTKSMAIAVCMTAIENKLSNPSSADFDHRNTTAKHTSVRSDGKLRQNTYQVLGFVTAENMFGGHVRTKFGCTVTGDTNGNWSVNQSVVM